MKVEVLNAAEPEWVSVDTLPENTLLLSHNSNGVYVRIGLMLIGFSNIDKKPWTCQIDNAPCWKLAPVGTKIILEQK